MSITQDLGVATAYGYAVSKGYTGTEEEFATLMASYATTALKAEGFAVGQQNGVDVDSGSPYYHNNAKYYAVNALAITDTASGAIASFPDGADNMPLKSLVINIDPVQDLHGYDNPWPAGGGKNLCDMYGKSGSSFVSKNLSLKAGTYTTSASGISGNYATYVREAATEGDPSGTIIDQKVNSGNFKFTLAEDTNLMIQWYAPNDSTSDLTGHTFQCEAGSSATTYAPYSNICPISGHTGANVRAAGKNLLPLTVYVGVAYNPTVGATFSTTQHGTQWTDNHDGTFTINTSATWQNYGIFMPVRNGHSYFRQFTFTSSGQGGFTEGYLDGDFKVLSKTNATTMPTTKSAGLNWSTYPTAKYYYVVFTNRETASATLTLTNPIVSSGTSAVTYEPYNATTKAVTWQSEAGTVYGGTLNLLTGKLIVDQILIDATTATWNQDGTSRRFRCKAGAYTGTEYTAILSNVFKAEAPGTSLANRSDYSVTVVKNNYYPLDVAMPTGTTLAQFNSFIADVDGNGTHAYILLTRNEPYEYDLDPVSDISTVRGQNNIWADTGDVEVEYYADTKLYINKIVAALA